MSGDGEGEVRYVRDRRRDPPMPPGILIPRSALVGFFIAFALAIPGTIVATTIFVTQQTADIKQSGRELEHFQSETKAKLGEIGADMKTLFTVSNAQERHLDAIDGKFKYLSNTRGTIIGKDDGQ